VTFDAALHEYRHVGTNRVVPSVTQVLKAVGVSTDFEGLSERSDRIRDAIELKRDLGTALHADAHAFDDNDLDWSTVDPRVEPYLRAWATFRENTGLVPLTRERRLYHPTFFYAGTLDGIFRTPAGQHVLCDIKTGDPDASAGMYQTAAYEAAYKESQLCRIDQRWAVQLTPDLKVPYRITNYSARQDAWRDFQKFTAFLTTYWEQACRRAPR
jgi:hypothetical protein